MESYKWSGSAIVPVGWKRLDREGFRALGRGRPDSFEEADGHAPRNTPHCGFSVANLSSNSPPAGPEPF